MTEGDYGEFVLESMSETMSRISIDCVSEADAGVYECVARTSNKKKSVGTEVHVVSTYPAGSTKTKLFLPPYIKP